MADEDIEKRLERLDKKMDQLKDDVKRYMEFTNKQHYDLMLKTTWDLVKGRLTENFIKDADENLELSINSECGKRDTCIGYFRSIIEKNVEAMEDADSIFDIKNSTMMEIKEKAPYEGCNSCIMEMSKILDKQVRLMSSLNVYRSTTQHSTGISIEEPIGIVKGYLEPIANRRRMEILLSLSKGAMTFSDLSKRTKLNGGNLLFHIQKLQDAGMIIQRHERGDYMITEKGFSTLRTLSGLLTDSG